MSKHTPGPWGWVGSRIRSRSAQCIVTRLPFETDCVGDETCAQIERWEADARLIAAAPDLLEALEKVFTDMNDDMPVRLRKVCYEALAKAKGEE